MTAENEYWSHISIEDLGDMSRIIDTIYGPFDFPARPESPFLVLLIDTDGQEWLQDFFPSYAEALAKARQDAVAFGGSGCLEIVDKVRGGHC